MKEIICNICIGVGFLLIMGVVGALDHNPEADAHLLELFDYAFIGMGMFAFGCSAHTGHDDF